MARPSNQVQVAGLPLMAAALIAGSFANTVSHLVLTQGVLYAIGGSIIYFPTLVFIDEWFIQRKGLAYGIMWAGTGTAGLIVPFVMNFLLSTYGFRTTLRVWAVVLILLSTHSSTSCGHASLYLQSLNHGDTACGFLRHPHSGSLS